MQERQSRNSRPLILGVTGHRNLGNDARLTDLVARELKKLASRYDAAPLLILSGLAEGADRLVITAASKAKSEHIAVLPLPDALYVRDFSGADSRSEYSALSSSAKRVIPAPLLASRRAIAGNGEPRNRQYAWIGAFIAKRAQVLIALWDGEPARGTGGTAEVVDWFLAGRTPPAYRISRAPRLEGRQGVTPELIHINPLTHKVRRTFRTNASPRR